MNKTLFKGLIFDRDFKVFFKYLPALADFINSYFEFTHESKKFGFADVAYQALIPSDNVKAADMYADIRCTLTSGEIILLEAYTSFSKEEYHKSYNYTYRTYSNQVTYEDKPKFSECKKVSCLNFINVNYRRCNDDIVNRYIPKNYITNKIIDNGETEMVLIRLDKAKDYLLKSKYEERFIKWLKLLNAKSIAEMELIGKGDKIMEQSIRFLKWYRKEFDSWHEELREHEQIGEQRGERRGKQIGEQIGEQRGIEKNKLETAKNLLNLGIDLETIIKATGISKNKIEKLKSQEL